MLEQERPANGRSELLVQLVQRLRRVASQSPPREVIPTRTLTRTLRSFRLADTESMNRPGGADSHFVRQIVLPLNELAARVDIPLRGSPRLPGESELEHAETSIAIPISAWGGGFEPLHLEIRICWTSSRLNGI